MRWLNIDPTFHACGDYTVFVDIDSGEKFGATNLSLVATLGHLFYSKTQPTKIKPIRPFDARLSSSRPTEQDVVIGKRLRQARAIRDVSQTSLARAANYSHAAQLSRIELGRVHVSEEVLKELARILDISPEWLISGSGQYPVPKSDFPVSA